MYLKIAVLHILTKGLWFVNNYAGFFFSLAIFYITNNSKTMYQLQLEQERKRGEALQSKQNMK